MKTLYLTQTGDYREGICQETFDHEILFVSWMKDKIDSLFFLV